MRITGDPNKHKYGNQILSGLGGAAGDVYTVAGWAKGDCVYTDDSNRRMYALMVRFYYTDGTTARRSMTHHCRNLRKAFGKWESCRPLQYVHARKAVMKSYTVNAVTVPHCLQEQRP